MGKVVELKPRKFPQQQLTCPECDGYTWQAIITLVNIEGQEIHHTDLYCQANGCEFSTPAILILPEGDD